MASGRYKINVVLSRRKPTSMPGDTPGRCSRPARDLAGAPMCCGATLIAWFAAAVALWMTALGWTVWTGSGDVG